MEGIFRRKISIKFIVSYSKPPAPLLFRLVDNNTASKKDEYKNSYLCAMRIYLDTSVIGGVFAKVFSTDTKPLFERVAEKKAIIIVSSLLETELLRAPVRVKEFLKTLPTSQIEKITLSNEAVKLAEKYIAEKVVGKTSEIDCQHIAIATICKADVLASWNFKHIVNLERIRGYNSINLRYGYSILEIRTPKEIFAI